MKPAAVVQQFRLTALAAVRRRPLRYALSAMSIAVAVALFVSMRITQASLLRSFRANMDALAGSADYTLTAPGGVPADLLAALDGLQGVRAAPLVQGGAVLADSRTGVVLFGIDPAREAAMRQYQLNDRLEADWPALLLNPDAVVVPASLAAAHGWSLGSTVTLVLPDGPRALRIGGVLKSKFGCVLIADGRALSASAASSSPRGPRTSSEATSSSPESPPPSAGSVASIASIASTSPWPHPPRLSRSGLSCPPASNCRRPAAAIRPSTISTSSFN